MNLVDHTHASQGHLLIIIIMTEKMFSCLRLVHLLQLERVDLLLLVLLQGGRDRHEVEAIECFSSSLSSSSTVVDPTVDR